MRENNQQPVTPAITNHAMGGRQPHATTNAAKKSTGAQQQENREKVRKNERPGDPSCKEQTKEGSPSGLRKQHMATIVDKPPTDTQK